MKDFVHLHLHSEYSLLDGACRIKDIPQKAKEMGQNAVAITDHGVMYGAVEFCHECKKNDIKPIIGCEVYVALGPRQDFSSENGRAYHHLILLCKNDIGYKNLIHMVSRSFTDGFYIKPRIDDELLRKYSGGLVCLSGCLAGKIQSLLVAGDYDKAKEYAIYLNDIFGSDNFYLELQNHNIPEDDVVNAGLLKISKETGIPMVCTNDVHYINREDSEIQKVLMCIKTGNKLNDPKAISFTGNNYYMRSGDEMHELFSSYENACENTVKIANMCNYEFRFGGYIFPKLDTENEYDPKKMLYDSALEGLSNKVENNLIVFDRHSKEEYKERIDYEFDVISQMGYCEYFLIVSDFVNYAKNNDIPVGPGRGSGASSLIAYLIGITDVDPVEYDLLFEAFLNPERISMPDFDIDFCYFRREEVVDYVRQKYGSDRVSKIIAFDTLAARAAVRDVGRALDMNYSDVDQIANLIPRIMGVKLSDCMGIPALKSMYDTNASVKKLIDFSKAIEGFPRNISTHAAGVVIADRPISEYVPLAVSGDTVVTQFDMNTIAELGLLKFDFLGLRYLTVINDTEKTIREINPDFDIEKIPLDDEATYKVIGSGRTLGLFQLESSGMRAMLAKMKPREIRDIMMAIALYRPGPAKFIDKFLIHRKENKKSEYTIDELSKILDETYDCIVYQEQVMQIFRVVAGYSYGKADIVRRAISKKKLDVIEKERGSFIEGAVSKGVKREDAENLFEDMIGFANYGFKKAHAAAYGILSYRTAYLKAHYPAHYYCALLSSELGDVTKLSAYINDANSFGIKLLPPDVNESYSYFSVVDEKTIRYGLFAIKNVGKSYVDNLVEERSKEKFSSFDDFISRSACNDMNKKQIESLIKAGAFDSLGINRHTLLLSYEGLLDKANEQRRRNIDGQMDMFSLGEENSDTSDMYNNMDEFPPDVMLKMEKEVSGIYLSGHPLDKYAEFQKSVGYPIVSDILDYSDNDPTARDKSVRLIGIIDSVSRKKSKSGEMAFCEFEDKSGQLELIIFNDVFTKNIGLIFENSYVVIEGKVSFKDDEPNKIIVQRIAPLDSHVQKVSISNNQTQKEEVKPKKLYIKLKSKNSELWSKCDELLSDYPGDFGVVIYFEDEKKYMQISNKKVALNDNLINSLSNHLGRENVIVK